MERISKIKITQKNNPNTMEAASVASSPLPVLGTDKGGSSAKINIQKKMEIVIMGINDTPQRTGPNGVIHNCPAQVARNTIKKKPHNPFNGRLEKTDIRNVTKSVMISAVKCTVPGMIKEGG